MMRCSSPSIFTSVPLYFENSTLSPGLTSRAISLPSLSRLPAPTATTFAWIGFYPLAIYLGQLDLTESLVTLLYGLGWAAASAGLLALLWRAARRRMVVQGG